VEEYLSERQQIEQVKGVIKENAPWAVAGILLGVALLVGWQQWHAYLERQALSAGQKYSATIAALGRGDADGAAKLASELRADYARTPYADMAALAMAHYEVDTGKLAEAAKRLEDVATSARDEDLRVVARLRLARVQRAEGKPDVALATLGAAGAGESPAFADVRGDVLADKGDAAGAISAWRSALASKDLDPNSRQMIELKVQAAGGDPTIVAEAPAAPKAQP
jgi:predicted negative regulator of RcsB-dependent stress response